MMYLTSCHNYAIISTARHKRRNELKLWLYEKKKFTAKDKQMSRTMKRSRITFDASPELRRRIKIAALQNDLSIGEYLGRILEQVVPHEASMAQPERRYATPETVQRVLRVRERLMQESEGELFEDSAELLRKQREERTQYLEQSQVQE
jgi:hypothetical protein